MQICSGFKHWHCYNFIHNSRGHLHSAFRTSNLFGIGEVKLFKCQKVICPFDGLKSALSRRRQFRHDNSSMASPIVTPTQSRTTFSASPTMACETPSMLETYEGVSYINEAINTSSSLGSCLEPILPIDGHTTIVTSFDEFMSFPGENRKTYFSNLISSPSQSMHPPPSLLPNKVVSKTKDLNEQLNFLFARPPPSFHNPV